MAEWISYADQRPETAGFYRWRVPSEVVEGLVVTFCAEMRKRSAGRIYTLSPAFDRWNGWNVTVPKGVQWLPERVEAEKGLIYFRVEVEGVTHTPCPFCKEAPEFHGVRRSGSGMIIGPSPHQYNTWWLECCGWTRSPRRTDPRILAKERNAILASREAKQ